MKALRMRDCLAENDLVIRIITAMKATKLNPGIVGGEK